MVRRFYEDFSVGISAKRWLCEIVSNSSKGLASLPLSWNKVFLVHSKADLVLDEAESCGRTSYLPEAIMVIRWFHGFGDLCLNHAL